MKRFTMILFSFLSMIVSINGEEVSSISNWQITPHSFITQGEIPLQQIEFVFDSKNNEPQLTLQVFHGDTKITENILKNIVAGTNTLLTFVPEPKETVQSRWVLLDTKGNKLSEQQLIRQPPRHWTFYLLSSSHVDIGLHKSQYKQSKMCGDYIGEIRKLVDQTANVPADARYRYNIEGTWFWSNYHKDYGEVKANEFVEQYVKPDFVSIGASQAGNHTQVYGFEELCRATYYKKELKDRWNLDKDTMVMADNNGITWAIVTPFVDAGIKNILWLPNRWNPVSVKGSRADVALESEVPLLFYWLAPDQKAKMLFWAGNHYWNNDIGWGDYNQQPPQLLTVEQSFSKNLIGLEKKYPYDIGLFSRYCDDELPNKHNADFVLKWNEKWRYPHFVTTGNLSEPFNKVREKFGDQIPTLSGDIPSGWAQHPVCAPELLAQKFEADSLLPTAEKLSTIARLLDPNYVYPLQRFRRAYDALLLNDEHSYGTSGYKGRDVYETWLQHRDWINKAEETAQTESKRALKSIAEKIPVQKPSVIMFNPMLQSRVETITVPVDNGQSVKIRTPEIPPLGYAVIDIPQTPQKTERKTVTSPPVLEPVLENRFYRLTFTGDGAISSIFDKELNRELLDTTATYGCNQFVYTKDAHQTFVSPKNATFEYLSDAFTQTVLVKLDDPNTLAAIEQEISLPNDEKRIDIDNRFKHVYDLFNQKRYYRFGYYAFPFAVKDFDFRAQINGCVLRPKIDKTGHTTDSYTAAREWVSVGNNDFTIGLVQVDSNLVEFGKIHADKKEMNIPAASSHIYSYIFTDWLQMHTHGGSAINPRFRYVITSQAGDWRKAGIAKIAERATTVVPTIIVRQPQNGTLPEKSHSFLSVSSKENESNIRLLTLKLSEEPEGGIIARFHETVGLPVEKATLREIPKNATLTECSVTEIDRNPVSGQNISLLPFGYTTIRMKFNENKLAQPKPELKTKNDASVTITWLPVKDAVQYNIYRGDYAEFATDIYHLLTTVTQPELTDKYLNPGQEYFYRIAAVTSQLNQGVVSETLSATTNAEGNSPPAPIGSFETGLVTLPQTAHDDSPAHLYLIWGKNIESDLSHYELYRSEIKGFTPNSDNFIAKINPERYRVVTFKDTGLKEFTQYYYRVRAVDKTGHAGEMSPEFTGTTREPYRK
ncbi:MAG: hypothetical protein LBP87_08255 [Planctomycetaceae bacterium]|jgi:hypothetical protein|nr:hypothetical protein [Planctomycetaceae bacterium]